jgi:outer membrane protein TolC
MIKKITKRYLKQLGCGICGLIIVVQGSVAVASQLDFGAAWQQVQEKSNALMAEQSSIDEAEYKREAARSLYLPQVDLTAGYLYLDDDVELGAEDILESMSAGTQVKQILSGLAQSMGLSLDSIAGGLTSTISEREVLTGSLNVLWPLYTGGRITAAQDITAAAVAEAKQQRNLKRSDLFEELCKRYFGVALARQIVDTRLEVEESLQLHLDHSQLMVENGQIAEVERLQAEASYDRARVEREKSEKDLRIAETALQSMLQEKAAAEPTSPLFISHKLAPVDTFIDQTLAGYPGLAVLDAKQEMAAGLGRVEKGKYFPEVALLGHYSLYEEDSLAMELTPDWFVGLTVSVHLLDRSGRGGKLQAARSLERRVELLRRQAREDLALLVEKTYREAEQAVAEYDGLASSLRLAEKTVELREKAFNQGLATSLDVIDSRLYVAGVKSQRSYAAYTYVTRLARLLAISGSLDAFTTYQMSDQ